MFFIIGLGNPGIKYQNNRHNAGHLFIDYLKNNPLAIKETKFLKTDCFMNLSGQFVKKIMMKYKLSTDNLIIVHDDLDIPLGKFKIQKGVGPKLHKGLESIEKVLGTKNFWRIRIGIDNRPAENRIDGEIYVLQDFLFEEKNFLITKVFPKIKERLKNNWS